jgi:hypothetical protein
VCEPGVEGDQVPDQGGVDGGRWGAGQALLDDDAAAVDVGGQLLPGGRDAGVAGQVEQRPGAGVAFVEHRAAPVGPAHVRRADLTAGAGSFQDQPHAGDVGDAFHQPGCVEFGDARPRPGGHCGGRCRR